MRGLFIRDHDDRQNAPATRRLSLPRPGTLKTVSVGADRAMIVVTSKSGSGVDYA
jgi:hypothetical protein